MTKKRMSRCDGETTNDYYRRRAVEAWEDAWIIYKDKEHWTEEAATETHKVYVSSKKISGLGKVFRLERNGWTMFSIFWSPLQNRQWLAQGQPLLVLKEHRETLKVLIDHSPAEVFDVLVTRQNDWPKWNPTILECHTVHTVDDVTDIRYSVAASQVGGLVSSRDFVNLCHWKTRDGILMSSACGVTHPDIPVVKQYVRATNNPACYVFEDVPNEPNKCQFTCILNTDLKGWLPQFLIDQAMSGVLVQYATHLINYLQKLQQDRENTSKITDSSVKNDTVISKCKDCKDSVFKTSAAECTCVH